MTHPASAKLILLPGLDGTDIFFAPLLRALPESVDAEVWPLPAGVCQTYPALLERLRQDLAGVESCWLLGWSFSGPLALMLAAEQPDRIRGVILVASFVRPPRKALATWAPLIAGPTVWLWRGLRRLPLWLGRARSDAMRRAKDLTWRTVSPSLLAQRLRTVAGLDARSALKAARVPLLYIASSGDGVVPLAALKEIATLRPDMQIHEIAGAHQSLFTHADQAVPAICHFVGVG